MRALLPALLLVLALPAQAQTAVDHYHDAARLYIGGDNAAAEQAALQGLALDPDDARLQALLDRIRQQQQQSGDGEQSDQNDSPDQQGGEQGDAENEGEQQDSEQPQEGEDGQQPQDDQDGAASDQPQQEQQDPEEAQSGQPQDEGREDEQPPSPEQQRPGEGDATPQEPMAVEPGQMTREEAERILNAVGADEGELLRQVQRRPGRGRRVDKDW